MDDGGVMWFAQVGAEEQQLDQLEQYHPRGDELAAKLEQVVTATMAT